LASNAELHYRPEVDGLRAVAVLSVLLFHAFPSLLPGGFVGVDMFFVISGFLITGIILKGLQQGNFSFREFYARRVGRIFPSLFLVLSVCLTIGWFVLFPDEYRQLAKHGFACPQFFKYWSAIANSKDIQTVVIGAAWEFCFVGEYPGGAVPPAALSVDGRPASSQDVDRAWKGLETTIRSLAHSGKRVVLLSSSPAAGQFNPRGMLHRFGGLEISGLLCIDESEFKRYIAPIEDKLAQIATRSGATVIHPTDYFCETGVCRAIEGDESPIYRDDQPLRPISAVKRAVFIDATLRP
jgi:hypothetical protein